MREKILLLLLLTSSIAFAQKGKVSYIAGIAEHLLENANVVINEETTEVTIESQKKAVVKKKKIVSVLNKNAEKFGYAVIGHNKSRKVKSLSVKYYDETGKELKKIGKNKFRDVSAISDFSLYEDDRIYYYAEPPFTYPYTMIFEYEYETSNTLFLPRWHPIRSYDTAVKKSTFIIDNPAGIPLHSNTINFDVFDIHIEKSEETRQIYSIENIEAIKHEDYSLPLKEITPILKLSPSKFYHEGIYGEFNNWEDVGRWIYQKLLSGQGELPHEAKEEIKELVSGIEDKEERVRLIYEYMQKKTRYISVQIGIGGWKPMSAEKVHTLGYGDCKALTNYTMALLKEADVESYYTVVYGQNKPRDIDKDFVSIQGNHVILSVPLESDTLWLECTNSKNAMGYIAGFTDDRNVLVVSPDGGKITRTKKYDDNMHVEKTIGVCSITNEGDMIVDVAISNQGSYYGKSKFLVALKEHEIEEYYKNAWGLLNNMTILDYAFKDDKANKELKEKLRIEVPNYIKHVGDFMTIRPYVLLGNYHFDINPYLKKERDFFISKSRTIKDEFIITVPDTLYFEALPKPIKKEYDFGYYIVNIEKINDHKIRYTRTLSRKKGIYPKEEYSNYVKLLKSVKKKDQENILLNKK